MDRQSNPPVCFLRTEENKNEIDINYAGYGIAI